MPKMPSAKMAGVTAVGLPRRRINALLNIAFYQAQAQLTDQRRTDNPDITFPLLGLFGETGSLLSEVKKKQRDQVAYLGGHPQFVCHGLTEFHRLKGSGRGIEEALGSNRQRRGW